MNDMLSDEEKRMDRDDDPADRWDGDGCPLCGEREGCAVCRWTAADEEYADEYTVRREQEEATY